ncbi:hypothetical protein GMD78_04690 [Ornithinibacillus sp. L9]|uniref:Uncharacterized protein n=1 Tax=Ornithinibacillus caprae TaxID=2678566 RepID=A0A6N8FK74_9BACI|nr:hypothetical protein [Ornithinibacillus caprae]MUK87698.1 hypothetical protein [Ornithinibacillus caprae]
MESIVLAIVALFLLIIGLKIAKKAIKILLFIGAIILGLYLLKDFF